VDISVAKTQQKKAESGDDSLTWLALIGAVAVGLIIMKNKKGGGKKG
jgi:hypothetical protein